MRRSKVEIQIDILRVLACEGPSKITHIMYGVNIAHIFLRQYLDLLIQHNLIEEQKLHRKRVAYTITEKGLIALKCFRELTNVFGRALDESNSSCLS